MNHIVRSAVVISLLVNIITNAIRPVIALTVLTPEDLLADSGGLNMFIFISFIVTSIFWLTTLILLDSSRMLEETKILEGKYRSLIESTDAAIMLIDRQGHLLYMNDIAARPYGKTQEEIIGTNVRDLFTAQWAETVLLDIEQVISSGNGINKEIVYDITGVKQYFRTNIMPIRNESETPYAATISYIDISDIRNAQEQISQSEENYKSLFFESPSGNLIYQDHRIIECNNAVAKMLGGECSQILGLTVGDISPEYQPNGRKSGEFAAEILQDALQTESGFFEWVLKRFDGTEFIVFVNVNAVIYNGQNSVLATWSDITALRKAEEETKKFRTMVEQANYGNAIVSMDGIIIYVNEALSKMHGWDTDELLGRNLTSLHGQEDLERVNFLLEKIKSQGGFAS